MSDDDDLEVGDGYGPDAGARLYHAAGIGLSSGVLAAGLSLILGTPALPVVAFAYLFGVSSLRGWKELSALLSFLAVVVLTFVARDVIGATHPGPWAIAGVVVGTAVSAFIAALFGCALVARMQAQALAVPSRGLFGRRREEPLPAEDVDRWEAGYFARLRARKARGRGYMLVALRPYAWVSAMFVVILVVDNDSVDAVAWSLALFQSILAVRLVSYVERLHRGDVAEATLWDGRPPVLLLRPFSLDSLPADTLDRKRVGFNFLSWLDKRSFEEDLAEQFEHVGPVIAIGRPGETVAPLGAARDYVRDDAWQERVLEHAQASQCVLMLVDDSPGMAWEIEHVTAAVGLQRVVVVLPPQPDRILDDEAGDEHHVKRAWDERWAALRARFEFLPNVTAGTGAVLYDESGQPVLVDAHKSIDVRVRAIRTAWEHLRGPAAPAWRASDVPAAQEALESAMLAAAAGIGLELPRGLGRRTRPRSGVAVGDAPGAIAEVERHLATVTEILGPRHAIAGVLHFLLGRLYLHSGDAQRACDQSVVAVEIIEAETRPSELLAPRRLLAAALAGLGDLDGARWEHELVLDKIKQQAEAGAVARTSRQLALERALGVDEVDLSPGGRAEAGVRTDLAIVCQQLGDLAGARAAFERALPVLDRAMAEMSPAERAGVGVAHDRFGLVLSALGERDAARAEHEQAVALLDAVLASGAEDVGAIDFGGPVANLGTLLYEVGELDAARTHLQRAIAYTEAAVGQDDLRVGRLRCTYGTILAALGEHGAARAELALAVGIGERALGADAEETQLFRSNLDALS